MPAVTLSVIVITRNEAARIEACLGALSFADEWIVVDWASSDRTVEIARRCGAHVVETVDWPGFGAQKQRALDLATGRWVLAIDADERVTPELAASIERVIENDALVGAAGSGADRMAVAYELSRLSSFCGRWIRHGDWYPDRVLRLFRREAGRYSADRVHERLVVDGRIGRLEGELLHDTMPTLADALDKMNRYSSGRALDRLNAGATGSLGKALGHGAWAFVRGYVLRRGFLDASAGFILAAYVAEGTYYRYLKMRRIDPPSASPDMPIE